VEACPLLLASLKTYFGVLEKVLEVELVDSIATVAV
jgi:hypothetical protein